MDLSKLREPFPAKDIEWRVQRSGVKNGNPWAFVLAYVTNRAIMDRLDDVCGPAGWKNYFEKAPDGGILCGIAIKCGDEWVTKWDGASNTDIEAVKGGLSSAMKRTGSQWNIGRYLYKLESNFATIGKNGKFKAKVKDGAKDVWFKWDPPALPGWALPSGDKGQPQKTPVKKAPTKVETAPDNHPQQGDIDGWIAAWKIDLKAGADNGAWWIEKKAGIIKDCTESGAKLVYKAVMA